MGNFPWMVLNLKIRKERIHLEINVTSVTRCLSLEKADIVSIMALSAWNAMNRITKIQ